MSVATYRSNISALEQTIQSFKGTLDVKERVRVAGWLQSAGSRLLASECPRAKAEDTRRAEVALDRSFTLLAGMR